MKVDRGVYQKVTFRFLRVGHTYLPCDAAFTVVTKKMKGRNLYLMKHLQKLFDECENIMGHEMKRSEFRNVDKMLDKFVKKPTQNVEGGDLLGIMSSAQFRQVSVFHGIDKRFGCQRGHFYFFHAIRRCSSFGPKK